LTASIVHEFNNPLCGVRTVLERMTRNPDLMDADRELLRLALANCDRMSRLLRDLQQFNRPFSDERRDFDLHRAIDSVLLLLNKHLQRHKAVLIQDYGSAPLLLHGAEDQIKQVLLHLIKTRAEALPETGGEIRIQTMREDGQVRIIFSEATNGVDPAPPSAQRSVPMFTCRTLRQESSLALAVSYSIVKAHGGEILVAFPPETGVAHTLILPAETNGIAR
jgi:C4-dicarboxylate-specific signal transduction histidine kinase